MRNANNFLTTVIIFLIACIIFVLGGYYVIMNQDIHYNPYTQTYDVIIFNQIYEYDSVDTLLYTIPDNN